MRLFGGWNASRDDSLSNPVIQGVVTGLPEAFLQTKPLYSSAVEFM